MVKTIDSLYYSVDVISFNRAVEADIELSVSTLPEVVATNSTSTMLNMFAFDFYNEQMPKLTNIIDTITVRLQNEEGTLDSYIQEILLGNACQFISQDLYAACNSIAKGSQTVGLVKLMLSLQTKIINGVTTFMSSQRALQDAQTIILASIGPLLGISNVVIGVCSSIAAYLETKFTRQSTDFIAQNTSLTTILLCVLLAIAGILYVFGLCRFRDDGDDVKKVLKNFPVEVMVKNCGLRNYLIKSSKELLAELKNKT